jgi:hypothetical protein
LYLQAALRYHRVWRIAHVRERCTFPSTSGIPVTEEPMKLRNLIVGCATVLAFNAFVHAAPADDVQAAAKKLTDSGYTWQTASENNAGGNGFQMSQAGKIGKDSIAVITYTFGDNDTQVVVGKDGKGAVKTEDGWKSAAELDNPDQQGPGRFLGRMIAAFKAPASQVGELAAKTKELKKTDYGYSADLTEEGAKELLAFGGRGGGGQNRTVKNAKGEIAYTIKEGALTRVKYTVKGTVSFNDQEREVDRTTTVEFSDVGTTKVDVPAEAKTKAGL